MTRSEGYYDPMILQMRDIGFEGTDRLASQLSDEFAVRAQKKTWANA
jgi:hypothetical protein